MSKAKSTEAPDWRAFEKLVARIEKAAAPRSATVKCPDRIADIVTGKKREVDASIRLTIGSVPVLITIECRKRKPRQDVTWIEQLSSKRQNLGAARTIAVASAGFSAEAEAKALPGGIVLRQIENVTAEDIETWLTPQSFIEIFRTSRLCGGPKVELCEGAADKAEALRSPQIERVHVKSKIFIKEDGEPISLNEIWLVAQAQKDFYEDIPWPEGRAQKNIILGIPEGSLRLQTAVGLKNVARITLPTELWFEKREAPLDQAAFHKYAGPDGVEIQRAEYELQLSNADMKLAMQSHKDSQEVSLEAEIVPRKSVDD